MTIVGLISPGQMGASVGAAVQDARVIWAGAGRSEATQQRARDAGIEDCGDLTTLVRDADIILSVCPPHDADSVATAVASAGFTGLFADCNAIAPQKTRQIGQQFSRFVDGGIIGGPAWRPEHGTCLYLSGEEAGTIAALFTGSPLHTSVISTEPGAASALKMTFAAYSKGTTALLAAILGVAEQAGVREHLEQQWGQEFSGQTRKRLTANAAKAWRFSGEMREIAATFEAAGFPAGFHNAAAEVFERLDAFKNKPAEDIDALLRVLLK